MFSEIRDRLLLPTAAGRAVNTFYYTYNLYPAYAIKSLDQRIMKACRLEGFSSASDSGDILPGLIRNDYLPVENDDVELAIYRSEDKVAFKWNGKEILSMRPDRFIAHPSQTLKRVSTLVDNDRFFRRFTFLSLLFAFPLLLYMAAASIAAAAVQAAGISSRITAPAACFLAGLSLFVFFINAGGRCAGPEDISGAASSPRWQDRVEAIRTAVSHGIDIGKLPSYERMKTSPFVIERCWAARGLGSSKIPGTCKDLLSMLDDPDTNVVCSAFDSIGKRRCPQATDGIISRLRSSDRWYCQLYAYRALRNLGWSQKKSAYDAS
jgi:hypothetical protein